MNGTAHIGYSKQTGDVITMFIKTAAGTKRACKMQDGSWMIGGSLNWEMGKTRAEAEAWFTSQCVALSIAGC